jgi:hypothetical protein
VTSFAETFTKPPKETIVPSFKQSSVLGVISSGYVSKRIQDYSDCEIPKQQRWAHVAAALQDPYSHEWIVIESHIDSGCAQYSLLEWWGNNKDKQIYCLPYYSLEPHELIVYPRERIKYGTRSIIRMKLAADIGLKYGDDPNGVFCSELLAKCDGGFISKQLNKIACEVKPADFQVLALQNGYQIVRLK